MSKAPLKIALRIMTGLGCIGAAIIMLRNHQSGTYCSIHVNYSDFKPYLCFLIVNFIVGIYNALVLFLPLKSLLWRPVVVLDLMMGMLLAAANAAALTVIILQREGSLQPIYNISTQKFCNLVIISITASFFSLTVFFVVVICSIGNLLNPLLVEYDYYINHLGYFI